MGVTQVASLSPSHEFPLVSFLSISTEEKPAVMVFVLGSQVHQMFAYDVDGELRPG